MGEATYYFVANFDSRENAKSGMNKIKQYLTDQKKAYDYWQNHRTKGIYDKLLKLHPLALSFLDKNSMDPDDEASNNLAGLLIDTHEPFSECLKLDGNFVLYSQEVWHFDDWTHLLRFAKSLKGCLNAKYESDEYANTDRVLFKGLKDDIMQNI